MENAENSRIIFNGKAKNCLINHASNVLGTVTNVKRCGQNGSRSRRRLVVDGAQAATSKSGCQALDCDFYAFSGHKDACSTGIGVLYGKEASSRDESCRGSGEIVDFV